MNKHNLPQCALQNNRKTIMILAGYYLPGFKGGGHIPAISNIVDHLSNEYNFLVIAKERDLGDKVAYSGIVPGIWEKCGVAFVQYMEVNIYYYWEILKLLRNERYSLLYLNSYFSIPFTFFPLLLKKLGIIPRTAVVLAPRGNFSPGAYELKRHKKEIYHRVVRFLGLFSAIYWQASSAEEAQLIQAKYNDSKVIIASELPTKIVPDPEICGKRYANEKVCRFVFISRISPKKNLVYALEVLGQVRETISFTIFGPIEDEKYWAECLVLIKRMPPNITVNYEGALSPDQVHATLSKFDAFLFPTRGENFGYVILEALTAGCIPIISDQTPWRDLAKKKIGWDIPLNQQSMFIEVIENLVRLDNKSRSLMRDAARRYAIEYSCNGQIVEKTRIMFQRVLESYDKKSRSY